MDNLEKMTLPFEQYGKYKCGAVTYEVTAHFISQSDSLKEKIKDLLKNNTQKSLSNIANSHKSAL